MKMVQLEGAVIGKKFSVKAEHGVQDFSAIILVILLLASWTKTERQPMQ